ncbi:MAG: hypothetical protein FJX76_12375 [Armatimonadetes bacterium]|nr:hypothetical protein [Armatimonadota bacterium]
MRTARTHTFLIIALGILFSTVPAHAQSEDRNAPSVWSSYGINGRGDGANHEYWYAFDTDPRQIAITVQARARVFSTGVAVDIFNRADEPVARGGAIATDANVRETTRTRLTDGGRYKMRITVDTNAADYSVWIDGLNGTATGTLPAGGTTPREMSTTPGGTSPVSAAPWTSYGINGNGDGANHEYWYALEAGPGDLTITVQARARVFSTGVTADLCDASGTVVRRRVGAIATSADVRESGTVYVAPRQRMLLKITVDANAGAYSVWIDGPVHH